RREVDAPKRATEDDHLGVEDGDQVPHAEAEPVAHLPQRRLRHRVAAAGRLDDRRHRVGAAAVAARGTDEGMLADLGLPAAAGSATARAPLRVDHHVADLAAVSTVAGHGPPAGDDAAADARVAVQVHDVVTPHGHAADVLGP